MVGSNFTQMVITENDPIGMQIHWQLTSQTKKSKKALSLVCKCALGILMYHKQASEACEEFTI